MVLLMGLILTAGLGQQQQHVQPLCSFWPIIPKHTIFPSTRLSAIPCRQFAVVLLLWTTLICVHEQCNIVTAVKAVVLQLCCKCGWELQWLLPLWHRYCTTVACRQLAASCACATVAAACSSLYALCVGLAAGLLMLAGHTLPVQGGLQRPGGIRVCPAGWFVH